jgi:hypothetical protein
MLDEEKNIIPVGDKMRVSFKDLSMSLKVLVVLGWVGVGFNTLMFLIGFIEGLFLY